MGIQQTVIRSMALMVLFVSGPLWSALSVFAAEQPQVQQKSQSMVTTQVLTFCISTKNAKPPDGKCSYTVKDFPDQEKLSGFRKIYAAAKQLESNGSFDNVPINKQRRASTLAQLRIWQSEGKSSPDPKEKITQEEIGDDLLSSTGTSKQSLSEQQQKSFDAAISRIYAAVETIEATEKTQVPPPVVTEKSEEEATGGLCSSIDNTICGEIADHVAAGRIKVNLVGDGETTSYAQLEITNLTNVPLIVFVPEGQVFTPDCPGYQFIMVREGTQALLKAGAL